MPPPQCDRLLKELLEGRAGGDLVVFTFLRQVELRLARELDPRVSHIFVTYYKAKTCHR